MIKRLKIGGVYKLLEAEDFYRFPNNKDNDEYDISELSKSWTHRSPGQILTYIKTIVELFKFSTDGPKHILKKDIPVFYCDDGLIIPYSEIHQLVEILEEVC